MADTPIPISDISDPDVIRVKLLASGKDVHAPMSAVPSALHLVTYVETITDLESVNSRNKVVEVWNHGGRNGTFDWVSTNQSANVTLDPEQGIYVAPASAPTGASGAWVRRAGFLMGNVLAAWWGMASTATAAVNNVAFAAAIAFGAGTVTLPAGACAVSDTFVPVGNQTIQGDTAGWNGISRLSVPAGFNAAMFHCTGVCTIRRIAMLGSATASETLQRCVWIDTVNGVEIDRCFMTQAYDLIKITGASFYTDLKNNIFYGGFRSQLHCDGDATVGFDINLDQNRFMACYGSYNIYMTNVGSIVATGNVATVNHVTVGAVIFDQKADLYGGMLWDNCVVEAGDACSVGAVQFIGTDAKPWNLLDFSNCLLTGGVGHAVWFVWAQDFRFIGGAMSANSSAAIFVNATGRCLNFDIQCDLEGDATIIPVLSGLGSTVSGRIAPKWSGTASCIDFSGSTVSRLDCLPGLYGTNANPVVLPAASVPGLRMHTGNGIQFPSTQVAVANVNTLDDYKEGTFTPVIAGTTAAGVGTYVLQKGSYTKIGDRVFGEIDVQISAHTGTGNMLITGLPYALKTGGTPASVTVTPISLTFAARPGGTISAAATQIALNDTASGAGSTALAMDTSCRMIISFTYATN